MKKGFDFWFYVLLTQYISVAFFVMRFIHKEHDANGFMVFLAGLTWPIWMPFEVAIVVFGKLISSYKD